LDFTRRRAFYHNPGAVVLLPVVLFARYYASVAIPCRCAFSLVAAWCVKGGLTWIRFFTPIAQRKMMSAGIESLTDVELLALFLRTGTRGNQ
jgi:hypothetical protein